MGAEHKRTDSTASGKTKVLYVLPNKCPEPIPSMVGVKRIKGGVDSGQHVQVGMKEVYHNLQGMMMHVNPSTPHVEGNENSLEVDVEVT